MFNIELLAPTNWEDIAEREVSPGVFRRVISAEETMVVRYRYAAGSEFPVHSHPEPQITIVESGRLVFAVHGRELELGPGGILALPGGEPHEARVVGPGQVVSINIFTPPKKEFLG